MLNDVYFYQVLECGKNTKLLHQYKFSIILFLFSAGVLFCESAFNTSFYSYFLVQMYYLRDSGGIKNERLEQHLARSPLGAKEVKNKRTEQIYSIKHIQSMSKTDTICRILLGRGSIFIVMRAYANVMVLALL